MDPGTAIRCETSKWGDRPHWQFDGFFLGSDEHGDWLGFPAGTHNHRPGHEFHSEVECVTLVQPGQWHLPTFQAPGIWCDLYVDVTTPAVWEGEVLRAVDLDLDVIRLPDPLPPVGSAPWDVPPAGPGEVFVDDEDEFAEHQVPTATPPTSWPRRRPAATRSSWPCAPACRRTTARTSAGWRSSLA